VLGLSDTHHFRRVVAGFCLMAAPVVLFAGAIAHPQSEDEAAAHLAVVAEDPNRYYAAHAVLLVGLALLLPAILALGHLLSERATALGHVGGAVAIIGLLGATALVAVDGIAITQMGQPNANPNEMAALLDRIKESAGFRAIAVVGAVSMLTGVLLLALGLWRTSAAHPLAAAGVAVAAIAFFIGQVTDDRRIFAIAFAIYLIVLAPLGWKILRGSDEDWALGAGRYAVSRPR
jgi:hypothetical protein